MKEKCEAYATALYLTALFVYIFAGVGPGRILFGATIACWITSLLWQRRLPHIPAVAWWALAYSVWVTLALAWGPTDEFKATQFYKHVAWLNIPVAFALMRTPRQRQLGLIAMALGGGVLAGRILYRIIPVWLTSRAENIGFEPSRWTERLFQHTHLDDRIDLLSRLIHLGEMPDGQRMAMGLLAAIGVYTILRAIPATPRNRCRAAAALIGLTTIGLLLTFKRGPLLALAITTIIWLAFHLKPPRRYTVTIPLILLTLGLGAAAWQYGPDLIETHAHRGGRISMWTRVTPALAAEYPLGIGYKALTPDLMRSVVQRTQTGHDHVHSTPLQAIIDGGWPGLLLFLGWFLTTFRDQLRYLRRTPPGSDEHRAARAYAFLFTTLVLIGFTEYQFGSGQVTQIYAALMGILAAGARPNRV